MTEMNVLTACRVSSDATELWTEPERRAVLEQLGHLRMYLNATNPLDRVLSSPEQILTNPKLFLASLAPVEAHLKSLREKAQRVRDLQAKAEQIVDRSID